MASIVQHFKAVFIEARFTPFVVSIGVLAMRGILFHFQGVPENVLPDTSFLWQYFAPYFAHPIVSFVSGTMFVFLTAVLISNLNNRFSLIRTRTNLPFIVPILLFSLHPYFLAMTPNYVAIVLLLIALHSLLASYQQPDTQLNSFRAAILIGVAGLFQVYALLLLPIWWRGEVAMRGVQLKSFFTSIFGIVLVYLSVFSIYFLIGNVQGFLAPFQHFVQISLLDTYHFAVVQWISITFVFVFFVLYMLLSLNISVRAKVLTQSGIKFVAAVIALFLVFQAVYWEKTLFFFLMNIALISYLAAYYHSIATAKSHVWLALTMTIVLGGVYLLNCFVF